MSYLGPSLRREKLTERPVRRTGTALLASLALNVLALWVLAAAGAFQLPAKPDSTRVALAPVSASQWEANRRLGAPKAPRSTPAQDDDQPKGRVVELSPEQKARKPAEKPPPDARFDSDRNSDVEKETVSRHADHYPRLAPRPTEAPKQEQPPRRPEAAAPRPPAVAGGGSAPEAAPGKEGAPGEKLALARPRGDLRLPDLGEGGARGRRARGNGATDLAVPSESLARIVGGPSMDGTHEGVEEGEETWLKSREFKYATFINQMRTEIGQQWYPRVRDAIRQRDPEGSLFAYKERTVVLGITLDTAGNVTDLSVLQSSSLDFFDRVAVASVREAQPFPNPPRGMFHPEDQVRIPFSFTMYPGSGRATLFWRPPVQ